MSLPLFVFNNLTYSYKNRPPIFEGLNLKIWSGEAVCLLGANGSGKSTLLKLMCGLIFATRGHMEAFGEPITEALLEQEQIAKQFRRRIGFIFQNSDVQLFTTRVWDEIAYGPLQMGLAPSEVRQRVNDILALLKIEHLQDRAPHYLSGGEKKKVAVASVLVLNPEVLIFDEPTSGLDPKTERWLTELLLQLNQQGRTIVVSTHNLELAHLLSNRSIVLSESHQVVADDSTKSILDDRQLLMDVNLIDEYCHFHGDREHIHRYTHG